MLPSDELLRFGESPEALAILSAGMAADERAQHLKPIDSADIWKLVERGGLPDELGQTILRQRRFSVLGLFDACQADKKLAKHIIDHPVAWYAYLKRAIEAIPTAKAKHTNDELNRFLRSAFKRRFKH